MVFEHKETFVSLQNTNSNKILKLQKFLLKLPIQRLQITLQRHSKLVSLKGLALFPRKQIKQLTSNEVHHISRAYSHLQTVFLQRRGIHGTNFPH